MKKVVYETASGRPFDSINLTSAEIRYISSMEMNGFHIVVSKEVQDEPKIERCKIAKFSGSGHLHYSREGYVPLFMSQAVDDPQFAGYEFDDGTVDRYPWKHSNNGDRCYSANFVDVRAMFAECAKYVLFRL